MQYGIDTHKLNLIDYLTLLDEIKNTQQRNGNSD